MTFKNPLIIAACVAALELNVLAENTPGLNTSQTHGTRLQGIQPGADRLNDAAKASEIIGMAVKNYQGEKLGKVEDLAVDVESGRIVQVILSTGGFIGIGDTLSAVPPGALHHDVAQKVLHLDANKEKLKAAPSFDMSKWADHSDSAHLSEVYRYYGQESSFRFIHRGDAGLEVRNNSNVGDANRPAPLPRQANRPAQGDVNGQRSTDANRTADTATGNLSQRNADGTWTKDRAAHNNQWMIPVARLGQVQKVSKLMGTPVTNLQDEKVGKVENVLVDLAAGRVVAVVVSSGGFLGIGDELSAIPPTALQFSSDRETLQLDTTKELLSNAPHFAANQWPDFGQPSYADGVYRAYKVEPYFTTNVAVNADNSANNVRDRNSRTLTPLDQGNSKADIATTAQIRKEIIADKTMSVNARNVKIITNGGKVTLRGPVNTAEEKRLIGEIASRAAQAENVDNQIEVTLVTSSIKN